LVFQEKGVPRHNDVAKQKRQQQDALMDELSRWGHQHATDTQRNNLAQEIVEQVFDAIRPRLVEAVDGFLGGPISPIGLHRFELALLLSVREIGRLVLQAVVQSLEPSDATYLPKELYFQCGGYRRRAKQTPNRSIATRFGNILLWRTGYRSWQRGEETIFPLELMLGLVENVSPAMIDWIGQEIAAAGMSQQATLDAIRRGSGVSMGVKRLRACTEALAATMQPLRQLHQADALLEMLRIAGQSSGSRKPVLCVGRDGITLRHRKGFFEVATAATLSVYDRAGKRLGTIYLAHPPELGQGTMDSMLTGLIEEVFSRWSGPLPRLAYVTDSGSNETEYFRSVLKRMKHPISGEKLDWTRVADFYHVSERVWAMADALFTKSQQRQSYAWARRMMKKLKQPSGASRVLHSAASLRSRRKLGTQRLENFEKAYRYIQSRTSYMQYHDYKRNHLPIGSGVTEAACKTVFTQRLKLSGMRWSHEGVGRILTLRTILLSGTWESTYVASLKANVVSIRCYAPNAATSRQLAA
jgi:hypothetical protein